MVWMDEGCVFCVSGVMVWLMKILKMDGVEDGVVVVSVCDDLDL